MPHTPGHQPFDTSPFDDVREELDIMVRGITDNAFRLGTQDPEAPQKFGAFISTTTVQADEQSGKQPGTTFAQLFDETVGRAAGAVGRGALGAGRFVQEGFAPVGEAIAAPFTTPQAQQVLGGAGQELLANPAFQTLDVAGRTGGALAAEALGPVGSVIERGTRVPGAQSAQEILAPTQFEEFSQNLAQEREAQGLVEEFLMQPGRTAFEQTEFDPLVRLALEILGDPLNLALPSTIPLLGGAGRGASAAERLAADQTADLASRTARVAGQQADTAAADVLTGPARQVVDVVPEVPTTIGERVSGGVQAVRQEISRLNNPPRVSLEELAEQRPLPPRVRANARSIDEGLIEFNRGEFIPIDDPRVAPADSIFNEIIANPERAGQKWRYDTRTGGVRRGVIGKDGTIIPEANRFPEAGLENFFAIGEGRPVSRGKRPLVERLQFEVRKGTLSPDVAEAAEIMARSLPEESLRELGSSFLSRSSFDFGDAQKSVGFYDTDDSLINIALGGIDTQVDPLRIIPHEISHHLSNFMTIPERRAVLGQFKRDLASGGEDMIRRADEAIARSKKSIREGGGTTQEEQLLVRNAYRFRSFEEFFAEVMADKVLRDIYESSLPNPQRSAFRKLADKAKDMTVALYNILIKRGRIDEAERVYQRIFVGDFDPEIRRTFTEGILRQGEDIPEGVGRQAARSGDEALEAEVAAAREAQQADDIISEGTEAVQRGAGDAPPAQPAGEIPGTQELIDRKIVTPGSTRQRTLASKQVLDANNIPSDPDTVLATTEHAGNKLAEAVPSTDKMTEFLRIADDVTKQTQDQIAAARRAGVGRGRELARGVTDPIQAIMQFRRGLAGTGTSRAVIEPAATATQGLSGGLPVGGVNALAPTEASQLIGISVNDFDNMYRAIEAKWPIDSRFELTNLNAQKALTNVILGELPQPAQIKLLRQVFGEPFIKQLLARRPGKFGELAFDLVFLLGKTLRSSWDASAPLRQLVVFTLNPRRVKQTGPMMTKMFKVGFTKGDSQLLANQFNDELINPTKNKHVLRLLDPKASKQISLHDISETGSLQFTDKEEVYASNIAAMLPGLGKDVRSIFGRKVPKPVRHGISATLLPIRVVGKGIRRSELMYATAINQTRMTIAGSVLDNWDEVARLTNGRVKVQQESIDELINAINIFTGRGTLPFGLGEGKTAKFLNALFWAPKLAISRFQAPLIGARGIAEAGASGAARITGAGPDSLLSRIGNSPGARARKEMAKDLVAFVGTGVTILAALDQFGVAEVETDPRSSDFGKGKFGSLRIDFWGGFQQPARYVAQAIFGVQKRLSGKNKGELVRLGAFNRTVEQEEIAAAKPGAKPTAPPNRLDLLYRFLQSKVAPGAVALTINELRGQTFIGDQVNELAPLFGEDTGPTVDVRTREALQQLLPLFGIDLIEAIEDQGVARGMAFGIGAGLGVGTQTFGEEGTGRFNTEETPSGGSNTQRARDAINRR